MARKDPQVNFRIPQELKEKLEKSAEANSRSITAELVMRLEESFELEESLNTSVGQLNDIAEKINNMNAEIMKLKNKVEKLPIPE